MSQQTGIPPATTVNREITQFLVSYGRKSQFSKGTTFITEGKMARTIYVLLEGEAAIIKDGDDGQENVVARVGSGAILGEIGVFMEETRTSSVRAVSDVLALEFDADSFFRAIESIPELGVRIIKSLSQKLKSSNDFILGLRKAHNLMVVGANILAASRSEGGDTAPFNLNLAELAKVSAIGRHAVASAVETLQGVGVITNVRRSEGSIEGSANVQDLIKYLNDNTFPRPTNKSG
ncbi:MAG: Crp/Fnr family transcriptional regulator [Gammaproteobacteria bacterium]|nr:Crp/Fnr family transcriptional regulator [Gammaproteobacteria bacterium]